MANAKAFYEALEADMSADFARGYTDARLKLGFNNPEQSPEYEDGYNAAIADDYWTKLQAGK